MPLADQADAAQAFRQLAAGGSSLWQSAELGIAGQQAVERGALGFLWEPCRKQGQHSQAAVAAASLAAGSDAGRRHVRALRVAVCGAAADTLPVRLHSTQAALLP